MKNQKGYAFLLVLGTIVIIGLLVPPLVFQVLSSSTQASQTEENIQLDNMYDMGKQIGRRHVEAALVGDLDYKEFEGGDWDDAVDHFNAQLKETDPLKIENLDFGTYKGDVKVKFTNIQADEDIGQLMITYQITPSIDGIEQEVYEEERFFLSDDADPDDGGNEGGLNWTGSFDDSMFNDYVEWSSDDEINLNTITVSNRESRFAETVIRAPSIRAPGQSSDFNITGPTGFDMDELKLRGQSKTNITGDAFFTQMRFDLQGNSEVRVIGNAYFYDIEFLFQHSQNPVVCVEGNVYDFGNNTFLYGQGGNRSSTPATSDDFVKISSGSCNEISEDEQDQSSDRSRKIFYTGERNPSQGSGGSDEGMIGNLVPRGTRN